MDEKLIEWIESNASNLAVKDELLLRENLRKLEEKFRLEFETSNNKQDNQRKQIQDKFWLHLARLSVKFENVELSLVVAAKLKLSQLALLLRSTLQQQEHKISGILTATTTTTTEDIDPRERLALSYVASYFHLDHELSALSSSLDLRHLRAKCLFDCEQMVNFHLDCGNWIEAYELIESRFDHNKRQLSLERQLIHYKLAYYCEIDENFPEALNNYEKSGTQANHSARVIIKQFLESAYKEFKNYSSSTVNITDNCLNKLWNDYSIACNAHYHYLNRSPVSHQKNLDFKKSEKSLLVEKDAANKTIEETGSGFFRYNLEKAEEIVFALLPERLQEFLRDSGPDKWTNKRTLESIISMGSSLSLNTKIKLAELAARYHHQSNQISKACCLYLCLNQLDAFLQLASKCYSIEPSSKGFRLQCQFSSTDKLAIKLMEFVQSQNVNCNTRTRRGNSTKKSGRSAADKAESKSLLFNGCLKLGLIDEALRVFSTNPIIGNERALGQAIEHLESLIEEKHSGSLDQIDPKLQSSTMLTIHKNLLSNQILSTQVITILILLITIFLLKISSNTNNAKQQEISTDNNNNNNNNEEARNIRTLEIMFRYLSACLNELNFNSPDSLIRSANSLVSAVKEKFNLISESEIVREGFKHLVDSIAGRCMIEGRYKSAAMLYSQIEDNVSAVKSLMRMGDVDVVINYSLLVRDITVNRITINYLRHLNVDQSVIEDFIAKTKPPPPTTTTRI